MSLIDHCITNFVYNYRVISRDNYQYVSMDFCQSAWRKILTKRLKSIGNWLLWILIGLIGGVFLS